MDYDKILPNLFVGWHPATGGDVRRLTDAGVTAVLNLQTDHDFGLFGVDWPTLRARYFASGIEVRRVPIRDFDDDDLRAKLPEAVRVLKELLDDGNTVYVHCSAGVNRSPSVVIAYLHWEKDWTLEEAERHVRKHRSCSPAMNVIQSATQARRQPL